VGFGTRLKEARAAKGLSQEALGKALAEAMGEPPEKGSKQGVSHWEKDRYQPNVQQIAQLCRILDCSADWLILGMNPEGLPADALEEARFFNRLTPANKKKWKALRPVFAEPATDSQVERAMPITKEHKETER
jgi:transcriptional regulator with XRE-family HTH domain